MKQFHCVKTTKRDTRMHLCVKKIIPSRLKMLSTNLWRKQTIRLYIITNFPYPLARPFSIVLCSWLVFQDIYPVSALSCCNPVLAGPPAFARPCEEVHRCMSLMCSSLLLQQCPACLVRLTLIVFLMGVGGRKAAVIWGVAARTCSILLVAFLCNCCQALSPCVHLASM